MQHFQNTKRLLPTSSLFACTADRIVSYDLNLKSAEPGEARRSQEEPGRSQAEPGEPGGARQEPGRARRSQEGSQEELAF